MQTRFGVASREIVRWTLVASLVGLLAVSASLAPRIAQGQVCQPDTVTRIEATIISASEIRLAVFNLSGSLQGPYNLRVWAERVDTPGVHVYDRFMVIAQMQPHSYNYYYIEAEPFTPLGTMNGYAQWQYANCPIYEMLHFYRGMFSLLHNNPPTEGDGMAVNENRSRVIVVDELGPGY